MLFGVLLAANSLIDLGMLQIDDSLAQLGLLYCYGSLVSIGLLHSPGSLSTIGLLLRTKLAPSYRISFRQWLAFHCGGSRNRWLVLVLRGALVV